MLKKCHLADVRKVLYPPVRKCPHLTIPTSPVSADVLYGRPLTLFSRETLQFHHPEILGLYTADLFSHFVLCLTSNSSSSRNIGGTDAWAVPTSKFGERPAKSPPVLKMYKNTSKSMETTKSKTSKFLWLFLSLVVLMTPHFIAL